MPEYDDSKVGRLCKRSRKAWLNARIQHETLREAYRWLLPRRYLEMNVGDREDSSTSSAYDELFDPTGMQALADGASQIAEALHPWDQPWARWKPKNGLDKRKVGEVQKFADDVSDKCGALISRSNFDGAAVASHKEFLLGTGFLIADRDPSDLSRIRFTATPAHQWAIEADVSGRIQAAFRRIKVRARDIEAAVPDGTWSEQANTKSRDQPDDEIAVEMAIYWQPDSRSWKVCWYEEDQKHEVLERDEATSPLICYRAGLVAGRAWGDGPGLQALPDVKVANKVVELTLQNAAFAVAGMYNAADDGVLNPANIVLRPGTIVTHAVGPDNGLQPIQPPGNFDVSQMILQDLRVNIRRAFYVLRIEEREMTAEEFRGRQQQQMREQRGVYGQLKNEFVEQVMRRVLDLAIQMGVVEGGNNFEQLAEVQLVGPLAADVQGIQVEHFKQAVADVQGIVGPELAIAAVKLEEAVPWLVKQRHADPDLFRSGPELKQIAQQVTQMMAQAAAAEQAQAGVPQPAEEQPQPMPGMA